MKRTHSLLIMIFYKTIFTQSYTKLFLYINIELSRQLENALHWANVKMTKMLLYLCTIGDKDVALPTKGLRILDEKELVEWIRIIIKRNFQIKSQI